MRRTLAALATAALLVVGWTVIASAQGPTTETKNGYTFTAEFATDPDYDIVVAEDGTFDVTIGVANWNTSVRYIGVLVTSGLEIIGSEHSPWRNHSPSNPHNSATLRLPRDQTATLTIRVPSIKGTSDRPAQINIHTVPLLKVRIINDDKLTDADCAPYVPSPDKSRCVAPGTTTTTTTTPPPPPPLGLVFEAGGSRLTANDGNTDLTLDRGVTDSYTVRLDRRPGGDMTVSLYTGTDSPIGLRYHVVCRRIPGNNLPCNNPDPMPGENGAPEQRRGQSKRGTSEWETLTLDFTNDDWNIPRQVNVRRYGLGPAVAPCKTGATANGWCWSIAHTINESWLDRVGVQTLHVALPDDLPALTIRPVGDITEGENAEFVITATPAPEADLDVTVTLELVGQFVADVGARTVTIPGQPYPEIATRDIPPFYMGPATYTLSIPTVDDDVEEQGGTITARINGGTASASVGVADNDGPFVPDAAIVSTVTSEADDLQAKADRLRKIVKGIRDEPGGYTAAECRAAAVTHGVVSAWKPWCDEIERRENT